MNCRRAGSESSWCQGRRHEFSTGGTDSGESKPPTPKFRFLLGFRPLYFENIGKSENFEKHAQFFLQKLRILGGHPPRLSNRGDTSPPSPPVATPMAGALAAAADDRCTDSSTVALAPTSFKVKC